VTGVAAQNTVAANSLPRTLDPTLHFAVIIGIDHYPAIRELTAARKDADAFKGWLRSTGVPEKNIRLIKSNGRVADIASAVPTRQSVDQALRELHKLVANAVKDDQATLWPRTRLYYYFSGHGVTPNAREAMGLMANAERGAFGDSIPCALYKEFYEDAQYFRELVFFADCCRSYMLQVKPVGPPFDPVHRLLGEVKSVLGFGAGFGGLAHEPGPDELTDINNARGYFTQALLEGLGGEAVDKRTKEITTLGLSNYVRSRVQALTKAKNPGPQQPQFIVTDVANPIVFAENVAHNGVKSHIITLTVPKGFSSVAMILDSERRVVSQRDATLAQWQVPLEDGLYQAVDIAGVSFQHDGMFRVQGGPGDVLL